MRFSIADLLDSRWAAGLLAAGVFLLWYWHFVHPFVGQPLMAAGDISVHVRFVQSAKLALQEGQFPIQYANDSSLLLQPLFLYYTPVFYTVAGGLAWLGLNANDALWAAMTVFALVAQVGLWLLLRELGCRPTMAAIAFGVLVTAPYFVTCLYARCAIAELSFLCLLPLTVHAVLVQSRRDDFRGWLYLSLGASLLVLSHKIFTAWLVLGLGGVHLAVRGWDVRWNLRFGTALIAAMILTSPYWLNAWLSSPYLDIAKRNIDSYVQHVGALHNPAYDGPANRLGILWSFLTSNGDVFALAPRTHPLSTTANLNLQIGPLLCLVCALAAWLGRERRALWVMVGFVVGSIVLACSFWELFPFWRFLPGPWRVIQFPYRMLTFTILAGSVLAACVVDGVVRKKKYPALVLLGVVAIYQLVRFDWRPGLSGQDSKSVESSDLVHKDYWEPEVAPAPGGSVVEGGTVGTVMFRKNRVEYTFSQPAVAGWVAMPVVCSRNLAIAIDGQPAAAYQRDKALVISVPAGARQVLIERREKVGGIAALGIWAGAVALVFFTTFRRGSKPVAVI